MDIKKTLESIEKYNVVFFDIFDTLIVRNTISPTDVFELVEKKYDANKTSKSHFKENRIEAERVARRESPYREVNINEIYTVIARKYGKNKSEYLKRMEFESERDMCVANIPIKKIYDKCIELGKKVYIVSDMYWPAFKLAELLISCGITGFEKVYASSDERVTKSGKGLLFKTVLSKENLKASDVIHIGNDKNADIKMAKKNGIATIYVPNKVTKSRYYNDAGLNKYEKEDYRLLQRFIDNTNDKSKTKFYQIGYEIFGPLLFGYCKWLKKEADKNRIQKIFFLSRDGYILKKGFDLLFDDFDTQYFCVSRSAVIIPSLAYGADYEDVIKSYKSWPKKITTKLFFKKIGLNIALYQKNLTKYNIDDNSIFDGTTLLKEKKLEAIYEEIKPDVVKNAVIQLGYFKQYLSQEKMSGKFLVVDTGGGCSIEYAMKKVFCHLDLDFEWNQGYFLITKKTDKDVDTFFDNLSSNLYANSTLRFCYLLLEVFLSAPHGSVIGYYSKNDVVFPLCDQYDYADGKELYSKEAIDEIQNGALGFVAKIRKAFYKYIDFNSDLSFVNFRNFGVYPKLEDANLLGEVKFCSDEFNYLAKPESITRYFKHQKELLCDWQNSQWPAGFAVRFFRSPIIMRLAIILYRFLKK